MFPSVQGSVPQLLLSWMVVGVWKEGKDFCTRPVLRVVSLIVGNVRRSPAQIEEEQTYICTQRNSWIFGELVILVICKQECEADAEPGGSLAAEQWELLARRDLSLVPKPWCSPCVCVFTGELCRQNSWFWEQELEFLGQLEVCQAFLFKHLGCHQWLRSGWQEITWYWSGKKTFL